AMDALVRQGRKVEVLEAYEQVGASVALPAPTLLAVASAAEGLKRHDLAQPAYTRLLREHPGRPEAEKAEFRLAHVLLATGRDADARAVWRDFLARYPESTWREYAEPRLAAIGPAEGTAAPAAETPAPAPAAPPAAGPDGLPAVEHEPSAETGWTF
ncbi:MAG: tetratricopeptide repeat protein, partial [Actinobacteria bacterium]